MIPPKRDTVTLEATVAGSSKTSTQTVGGRCKSVKNDSHLNNKRHVNLKTVSYSMTLLPKLKTSTAM
jgi:hypothetical protein